MDRSSILSVRETRLKKRGWDRPLVGGHGKVVGGDGTRFIQRLGADGVDGGMVSDDVLRGETGQAPNRATYGGNKA